MKHPNYLAGLESERIRFTPFSKNHIPYLLSFFGEKSNLQYINPNPPPAKSYVPDMLKRQEDLARRTGFGFCALIHLATGEYLGQGGFLIQIIDDTEELEIAYHLMPAHRGQGFATEIAQFCRDLAFQNQWADSLISIIHIDNIPSKKVAMRNGMTIDKSTTFRNMEVEVFRIKYTDWMTNQQ